MCQPSRRAATGRWLARAVVVACLGTLGLGVPPAHAAPEQGGESVRKTKTAQDSARSPELPQKVFDVLEQIQQPEGAPPPGFIGGRIFQNRERRLPRGAYREYDVNPKIRGQTRGPERLVIDQRSGKAYYSPDHYRTFAPIN